MKKLFDRVLAGILLICLAPLMLIAAALVKWTSPGSVFYRSQRVGRDNQLFAMYKFRTMRESAPQVATHLLVNPANYLTRVGRLLRQTSLDELPQLFNVLRGEMSLVGPRPALFNQHDLIEARTRKGVHRLLPGVTGWAQVNGRDELSILQKVAYDEQYLQQQSLALDARILVRTVVQALRGAGVSH
jgi:O-antigen biosynthesis protein WbqP